VTSSLSDILERTVAGERLAPEDAVRLLESHDLAAIAGAADAVTRRMHPESYRTYNIDRNINYTNICTSGCRFCAFSCRPGDAQGYVLSREELFEKIEQTIALGGNQILLQGGMNPELSLDWFERLFRDVREAFPQVNIHGLSPPEIDFLAQQSGLSIREVLERLRAAGLGSLPGGGAEILVDRVRQQISPKKTSADRWLEVCREWHKLGGRGSATMMFGHVETLADRVEHLARIRDLQDETGGFTAFIAWTFQSGHTAMDDAGKVGAFEYLKTLAVARLFLDNVANLQASWVTQGMRIGQLALRFGANDLGSLMIEENVVAQAGTVHYLTLGTRFRASLAEIQRAIHLAGYEPRRRDVFYQIIEGPPDEEAKDKVGL